MSSITKMYFNGDEAKQASDYFTYYLQRLNALSDTDIRDFITVNSSDVMKGVFVSDTEGYPDMVTTFPEEVDALLWDVSLFKDRLREQYQDDKPAILGIISMSHTYQVLQINKCHCRIVKDGETWYIRFGEFWRPVGQEYGITHYTDVGMHSAKEAVDIIETEYAIWLMTELGELNDSN